MKPELNNRHTEGCESALENYCTLNCNVNLRKLLSDHKSHDRETSFYTGAIPNQVHNSQTSRFASVPGQIREGHVEETAWGYGCNWWY